MLRNNSVLARQGLFKAETIITETLKAEHMNEVIDLFTTTFCEHEPMTHYLSMQYTQFRPFAELVIKKAVSDGLSVVAHNGTQIVACAIVEDMANPINVDLDRMAPQFKFIFGVLEQLSGHFFEQKKWSKNNLSHLFITAVEVNHLGRGLSKKVNVAAMKLAEKKGFDFMCCEFTNELNEKGTLRFIEHKKALINSCCYKEFIIDGETPFPTLKGSVKAYLWELKPEARLHYHPLPQTVDNLTSQSLEEIYPEQLPMSYNAHG